MLHSIPLSLKVGLVTMHSAKKEGWRYGVSNSQRDGSQGNVIYVRFWIIVTNARENPLTKIVRLFRVIMRNGISTLRVVFCTAVFFSSQTLSMHSALRTKNHVPYRVALPVVESILISTNTWNMSVSSEIRRENRG